jgi:hypothetical protein
VRKCTLNRLGCELLDSAESSDTESIRAVKSGDLLVEQDTDFQHAVLRGSDGSRALVTSHAHFTVNANGEATVEFVTDSLVCT